MEQLYAEYRSQATTISDRITELEKQLPSVSNPQERKLLRHRIITLYTMLQDTEQAAQDIKAHIENDDKSNTASMTHNEVKTNGSKLPAGTFRK